MDEEGVVAAITFLPLHSCCSFVFNRQLVPCRIESSILIAAARPKPLVVGVIVYGWESPRVPFVLSSYSYRCRTPFAQHQERTGDLVRLLHGRITISVLREAPGLCRFLPRRRAEMIAEARWPFYDRNADTKKTIPGHERDSPSDHRSSRTIRYPI